MKRPLFCLVENGSKNIMLVLPYEAHMIQATILRSGFCNYFKLDRVDDDALNSWAKRNLAALSDIVWFAYDQKRYKERRVGTNLVRQVEIDLPAYRGWAFV